MQGVDRQIAKMDPQLILSAALLPHTHEDRKRVVGALIRATADSKKVNDTEDMVQVLVPGGGKAKLSIWMTRKDAEKEWASR